MSEIVIIDTSVYLNVLDIPGWNQDRKTVLREFEARIKKGDHFLLPMATIWETGNHIADLATGARRREFAEKLVSEVHKAVSGTAPYRATYLPERETFLEWIVEFPDFVMRNKSAKKIREGVSLADLSLIKEWDRTRKIHSMTSVLIWSLDSDLSAYNNAST